MSFDITYQTIMKEEQRPYRVGLLLGTNKKAKIVPFGFCSFWIWVRFKIKTQKLLKDKKYGRKTA